MVLERQTYEGFLSELEQTLPVNRGTAGPYFRTLGRDVIPVYNVGAYDPGSSEGVAAVGAADYGLYGAVLRIERGIVTQAITGVPGKPTFTMTPPPGEVHVYQTLSVLHDQGSNVDFFAEVIDALIPGGMVNRWEHAIVTSAVNSPLLRTANVAKSVDDFGPGPGRDYVVYPLQSLIVESTANMSTGKQATLSIVREVYKTIVLPEDQSITIIATQT